MRSQIVSKSVFKRLMESKDRKGCVKQNNPIKLT